MTRSTRSSLGYSPREILMCVFFLARRLCVVFYANPKLSSGITLAPSQTEYGCQMPLRLETGCFSPWLAGTRSHYRKIPVIFHQDEVKYFVQVALLLTTRSRPQQVQNHTVLAWILSCMTPLRKLKRITTWKVHRFVCFLKDKVTT